MYYFKKEVQNDIPPTTYDIDVYLSGNPISIKTITKCGTRVSGIKAAWIGDPESKIKFIESFEPKTDILLSVICWNNDGGLYYIPVETQKKVLLQLGKEKYFHSLNAGTNNKGIEYSAEAIQEMRLNAYASIPITWVRNSFKFDPFDMWVEEWKIN